jgi:hydrogenase nickel incorporation protein HypB
MKKKIDLNQKILKSNEDYAVSNRRFFESTSKLCFNMISSPGSGKTTILCKTIDLLKDKIDIGVIEGDVECDYDAQRIKQAGADVYQIETKGACHLSAAQISRALSELPCDKLDAFIIENVGNLVCPSAFELGETAKIAVLSVAEGDDKPAKYPAVFAKAKAVIISKIDLLQAEGLSDFDIERVKKDARKLNKNVEFFELSARTEEGMQKWCDWLGEQIKNQTPST